MKKSLKLVATAALLTATAIPMSGCFLLPKNVSKISPYSKYTETYNSSWMQTNMSMNSSRGSYSFLSDDNAGTVVVKETRNDDMGSTSTYYLMNLATGSFTGVSSQDQINPIGKGLFYSVKTTDADGEALPSDRYMYTLYSANSVLMSNVKGTVSNGSFVQENGTRWYVDYNGNVKQSNDPFEILFTSYDLKLGNYYVDFDNYNSSAFSVYNKNGEFERKVSVEQLLNLSEDASINMYWTAGDKVFTQVEQPLPDDAKNYDYITETEDGMRKYELKTYSYSVKNDNVKEIKNFPYYVDDSYFGANGLFDYTILYAYPIVEERISANGIVQSFDGNGKVYFDIQDAVPGADDVEFYGEYTVLEDCTGMNYVYQGKELVMSLPANTVDYSFTKSNEIYYTIGSTLYIYDLNAKSVLKTINNVSGSGKTVQGNIWYGVYDQNNNITQYYIYNVDTGLSNMARTVNNEKQELYNSFSSTYCKIVNRTDEGSTYTLYFPDSNIQEITSKGSINTVGNYSVNNDPMGMSYTTYTIFCVQSKDQNNNTISNYYILTENEGAVEKK